MHELLYDIFAISFHYHLRMFLISAFWAKSYAVLKVILILTVLSAPMETKYFTMLVFPKREARCNGVHFSLSFALIFAPLETRYSAIGR